MIFLFLNGPLVELALVVLLARTSSQTITSKLSFRSMDSSPTVIHSNISLCIGFNKDLKHLRRNWKMKKKMYLTLADNEY